VRHSSFSVEGRYRILRLSGYAENVADAASRLLSAHENADDQDPLPEVCAFLGSLDTSAVVHYDSLVSGRNRSTALEQLTKVEGFRGLAAIDNHGQLFKSIEQLLPIFLNDTHKLLRAASEMFL
jgi:hypothetical protein